MATKKSLFRVQRSQKAPEPLALFAYEVLLRNLQVVDEEFVCLAVEHRVDLVLLDQQSCKVGTARQPVS